MSTARTPVLAQVFQDSGSSFSSSPHTGLLWALETLAWSEEHAAAAIDLLARLAEIDPGGKLANRPLKSLVDIFRPWMPQTSLDVSRRISAIDMLRRNHTDVAWPLMLALLPEHHGVGRYTHAPRFRDWKAPEVPLTYADLWEFNAAIAERLLEDVVLDHARWSEMVERFDRFPPAQRVSALERLRETVAAGELPDDLHERVWRNLDELARKHLAFVNAEWALPREESEKLAETAKVIEPSDPVAASVWLFDEHLPNLGDERLEYHAQEARAVEARVEALRAVVDADGLNGVLRLAARTSNPWFVGSALVAATSDQFDAEFVQLFDSDDSGVADAAAGFVASRIRVDGEAWIDRWLAELADRPTAQSRLLLLDDDIERAWSRLAQLGDPVRDEYWRRFSVYGRGDFQQVNEAVSQLLRVDRPLAAVDLMALYVNRQDRRVDPELIVVGLRSLLSVEPDELGRTHVTSYELGELLNYLRSSEIDENVLAQLEWQLRPALGFDVESPVLERRLARDPAFFIEVLSLVYKPRHSDETPAASESVAENAWHILDDWKIVPGSQHRQGDVDQEQLDAWLQEARERAAAADRTEVGDLHIGMAFAHSKTDEDGTWPTRPVRDAIEHLASLQVDDGFRMQIFNNRGVSTRGVFEGGHQERELAARYAGLATQLRDQWQRTAGILRSLAQGYEREAARFDDEVERRREGLGRA